jgi:hypothetical protein
MKKPQAALVVTTIGDGQFLNFYAEKFKRSEVLDRVTIYVIPDLKTPASVFERCRQLQKAGVLITCPSIQEQEIYLSKLGISTLIAYNSDHRRNVGFLMALAGECEYLISIDDDNLCKDGGAFIDEHAIVCQGEREFEAIDCASGWYNICELLEVEPANVYPRGLPYRFRRPTAGSSRHFERGVVHLNAGLWLGEPDLDAITWLANPATARSFRGTSLVLGRDTWSPINTQNTALHRDAVAAFYFVSMAHNVAGMQMGRYGDIFSGYFCQACIRHLGYRLRVGTPVVDHLRNRHNYLSDLNQELPCIWLLEDVAEWLRELRLEGNNYPETYLSLADAIDAAVEKFHGFIWDDSARSWFHATAEDMRLWIGAVRTVGGLPK